MKYLIFVIAILYSGLTLANPSTIWKESVHIQNKTPDGVVKLSIQDIIAKFGLINSAYIQDVKSYTGDVSLHKGHILYEQGQPGIGDITINFKTSSQNDILAKVVISWEPVPCVKKVFPPPPENRGEGDRYSIAVEYKWPQRVRGRPLLTISIGENKLKIPYESGSGSKVLVFARKLEAEDVALFSNTFGSISNYFEFPNNSSIGSMSSCETTLPGHQSDSIEISAPDKTELFPPIAGSYPGVHLVPAENGFFASSLYPFQLHEYDYLKKNWREKNTGITTNNNHSMVYCGDYVIFKEDKKDRILLHYIHKNGDTSVKKFNPGKFPINPFWKPVYKAVCHQNALLVVSSTTKHGDDAFLINSEGKKIDHFDSKWSGKRTIKAAWNSGVWMIWEPQNGKKILWSNDRKQTKLLHIPPHIKSIESIYHFDEVIVAIAGKNIVIWPLLESLPDIPSVVTPYNAKYWGNIQPYKTGFAIASESEIWRFLPENDWWPEKIYQSDYYIDQWTFLDNRIITAEKSRMSNNGPEYVFLSVVP